MIDHPGILENEITHEEKQREQRERWMDRYTKHIEFFTLKRDHARKMTKTKSGINRSCGDTGK